MPDDSVQPPKHVGVDLCHVYVFVCTSCWFYKMSCSSWHVMNTVKTIILSENDISCAQTWRGVGGNLTDIFLDHQGYCTKLYCGPHVLFVFVVVTLILSCDCRCNLWLLWGEDNHVFCLARPLHHSSDCARCGWFYFLGKRQTLSVHGMKIVHYFCLSQILFLTYQSCLHFIDKEKCNINAVANLAFDAFCKVLA